MTHGDWREIGWDPETLALRRLSAPAVDILNGRSSPFVEPRWVDDFKRNRRRLELSSKQGAETLDAWRAQTEERIATLLGRRPWGLLPLLSLLRRLPIDVVFLGVREQEGVSAASTPTRPT